MTSPMKHKRCFYVPDGEPEVSFGSKHVAIPLTEIKRSAAQACKQFSATVLPCPSHLESSIPSFAGSVNQQTDGKVMESVTPGKGNPNWLRSLRERCQENFSLYLRRRAARTRGFVPDLAEHLACSQSKASKLTYGEANPHWLDPFLIILQEDGLLPFLREVLGDDYADAVMRREVLRYIEDMLKEMPR